MGLRGPGARPPRKVEQDGGGAPTKRPDWRAPGLTRAQRVIRFCEGLTITSGQHAGKPLKLRPWQRRMIERIYATDRTGARLVRQAVVSMGRKNGKSALAAALALAHLVGPEAVPRGQVVSAAADRGQAALIWTEVQAFALAHEELRERLVFRIFNKTAEDTETGSTFAALSADHRKAHGLSPTFAIADEVAQWRGRELLDALRTGMGAHAEPLLLAISTRSPDPDNPLEELLRYGEEADDPTFASFVWSAPVDADPWAKATWKEANPGLGDFRSLADVELQAKQAMRLPSLESAFRAYVLNQPVGVDQRFIGPRDWDACAGTAEAVGRCYGGLDLSSGANDLTAFSLYWPETGLLRCWGFIPAAVLDNKAHEDRADYRLWQHQGHIFEMPGKAIDRSWLGGWIARETEALDLVGIASDEWGLNDLLAVFEREGIRLPMTPMRTGYKSMSPAVHAFEVEVISGRLRHGGNPLLRWAVANMAIDMDPSGNRKPAKDRARGRIDPAVAAIEAVGLHARQAPPVEINFDLPLFLTA
jgi:phage terminase large subunit-like protein